MPSNQENIEAKLAAYVDGELSGADREEIERHLTANPQHRKLMAELKQTSSMLRDLPHAKAPADVLDSLQSQLERAALLGRPEELHGEDSYKIGFWTQFRAIAAIVILTIGLAIVVYFVLPRNAPNIELATKDTPPVTIEDQAKPDATPALTRAAPTGTAPSAVAAKSAGPVAEMKKEADGFASKGGLTLAQKPEEQDKDVLPGDVRQQLAMNGVPEGAAYLVVDTSNAPLANATVSNYLNFNRTTWEQMPAAGTNAIANIVPGAADILTNAGEVSKKLRSQSDPAVANRDGAITSNATEQQATRREINGGAGLDLSQNNQFGAGGGRQQFATNNNIIIARNLNSKQIDEINGLLNQRTVGTVSNFTRAAINSPAQVAGNVGGNINGLVPAPTPGKLNIGDTVIASVNDPMLGEASIALQVDPAGNVMVHDLGEIHVLGMSLDDLNATIATKYKDANLEKKPPVAIEIKPAQQETAGAKEGEQRQAIQSQIPMQLPGAQANVQMQDQTALSDLVIVIREVPPAQQQQVAAPIAPSNAAPTTQQRAEQAVPLTTQPTTAPTTQP